MAHGYRTLQHWNQWLTNQFLGIHLLEAERKILATHLKGHYGKHAVLVGVPEQHTLLNASELPFHVIVSPFVHKDKGEGEIESDLHQLPLLTGSTDLVILPHTLEFADHPRQLLAEACRIVKPEGLIVVMGFNPYSAWGMRKLFSKHKTAPWSGTFLHPKKITNWLKLADFQLEEHQKTLYRPPVKHHKLYHQLHFLEQVGRLCYPCLGGVYMLSARAKVVPLTPIKMKWKQQLSNLRIPTSMPGHIARQSELTK